MLPSDHDWSQGHIVQRFRALPGAISVEPNFRARRPPVTDLRVKAVCRDCNTGWMSRLEESVRPLLTQLIAGQATQLDDEAKTLLALWAFKTAGMFQMDDPQTRAITFTALRAARHSMTPPPGTTVHMFRARTLTNAMRLSNEGITVSHRVDPTPPTRSNVSSTILLAERVGFAVLYEGRPGLTMALHKPGLTRIWPLSGKALSWPPSRELTDADIGAIATRLTRLFGSVARASRGGI